MKTIASMILTIAISACGSGGLPDDSTADADVHGDAEMQAAPGTTCDPEVVMVAGIPFGTATPDVTNCLCGIGCHIKLAPDCNGYYCEQVCNTCP